MEQYLDHLLDPTLPHSDLILYLFIFISSVFENLFPPVPGDTIILLSAFLVGTGRLNYFMVFIASASGNIIGFNLLFLTGRYFGKDYFFSKNFRVFSRKKIESAEKWFKKKGYMLVLANRFMPGVRSVISLTAGILQLKPLKIFILSTISISAWTLIWIHVGYTIGDSWDTVKNSAEAILRNYNIIAGILVAAGFAFLIIRKYKKIKRKKLNAGKKPENHPSSEDTSR